MRDVVLLSESKIDIPSPSGMLANKTALQTTQTGLGQSLAIAIVSWDKSDSQSKIAAMEAAGIRVSPSPARLGTTLVDVLKG